MTLLGDPVICACRVLSMLGFPKVLKEPFTVTSQWGRDEFCPALIGNCSYHLPTIAPFKKKTLYSKRSTHTWNTYKGVFDIGWIWGDDTVPVWTWWGIIPCRQPISGMPSRVFRDLPTKIMKIAIKVWSKSKVNKLYSYMYI